jgi:S-methylmethionine-dependent homocysteine/selenocysteine methylase
MNEFLILDGAVGTQLENYNISLDLPIWSADANIKYPETIIKIHKEYILAGADIITANTFRSTPWTYRKAGFSNQKAFNTSKDSFFYGTDCAFKAANSETKIAASITAVDDCYISDSFVGKTATEDNYGQLLEWISQTDVNIILFETMGSIQELQIAIEMSINSKKIIWISLIMKDKDSLLDGTPLHTVMHLIQSNDIDMLLLNCNNFTLTRSVLLELMKFRNSNIGVYPNLGLKEYENNFPEIVNDSNFKIYMHSILDFKLSILGTCCGSSPNHTKILKTLKQGI